MACVGDRVFEDNVEVGRVLELFHKTWGSRTLHSVRVSGCPVVFRGKIVADGVLFWSPAAAAWRNNFDLSARYRVEGCVQDPTTLFRVFDQ